MTRTTRGDPVNLRGRVVLDQPTCRLPDTGERPVQVERRRILAAIAGGHEVLLVGYQPSPDGNLYDLISWGAHYRATERFLFSRLDEAVAVVNSAFLDAEGHDPVGLHLPELLADMALLREE